MASNIHYIFIRFGEVYFSLINPGVVKAWKRHKKMTQQFAVPVGKILLVLFDDRPRGLNTGMFEKISVGMPDRYFLICIPPMVWYGFKGISDAPSLIANCTDLPHDPEESEEREISDAYFPSPW